jgi:hypothetical protein
MAINGAEGTTYISQVSAWSIAGATTEAQTGAHEYAIEQQKAAEREATEKPCAIASMCITLEEEGNGPGEVTFGDPVHCHVGGKIGESYDNKKITGLALMVRASVIKGCLRARGLYLA